jgi:uncharacterized protein
MNRLASEKSPYLLQHAENPVDWYPWGDEAFAKAREENKPVFLSIGYATCHWCHVMEHESFEDEEVARLMNEAFISIKVDREERPDIDNTYMTVCQMLTGHGGWPLTIIMTPDKEPFYAATYLPKDSRPNRVGMTDLVPALKKAWHDDRERVMESVQRIKNGFQKSLELGRSQQSLPYSIIADGVDSLSRRFDEVHGGFGGSPKFPSPHNLLFLIQNARINGHEPSKAMAEKTLLGMRLGGIWDHAGFGFHRYSTDHRWLLPHFEKMLYDQAMLLMAYAEGWKLTGNPLFKQTSYEIVKYVDECLTSPEGVFYSAEDADSEGEEGKFYVWTSQEIRSLFSGVDAGFFLDLFSFSDDGNFRDEATGEKTGANIPHLSGPPPKGMRSRAEELMGRLKKEREKRVRPLLDDKVLTDWNGLMIAALARAGVIFNDSELVNKAAKAWQVISDVCVCPGDRLLHRLKEGEAGIEGMADDYAFSILALTELYSATYNPEYLVQALHLQEIFDRKCYDEEYGGYFFTPHDGEPLLGRQKEIYDGAIPSSNSAAALNGFRLSRLSGDPAHENRSHSIFKAFSEVVADSPSGYTFALLAWQLLSGTSNEIVICAEEENDEVREAIRICHEKAPPGSSVILKTDETEILLNKAGVFKEYSHKQQAESNDDASDTKEITIYVCTGFSCKAPVHSAGELSEIFDNQSPVNPE